MTSLPPHARWLMNSRCWHVCGLLILLVMPAGVMRGDDKSSETFVKKGVPGGLLVETTKYEATVTEVDAAKRQITLVDSHGKKRVCQAGLTMRDPAPMKAGDHVRVTVTEQYLSFVRQPGSTRETGAPAKAITETKSAEPKMLWSSTTEWSGRIASIDVKRRMATVLFPDGRRQTCHVRPDVDMTSHKTSEEVVFQMTESVAIRILK